MARKQLKYTQLQQLQQRNISNDTWKPGSEDNQNVSKFLICSADTQPFSKNMGRKFMKTS